MPNHTARAHRTRRPSTPDRRRPAILPDLETTPRRLAAIAALADIALHGSEPERGVRYLFDALELLREDLRPFRHLRPRTASRRA